jgi:peptidyl-tRNA hydrolase, PTH1 family
MKLVVGLGNPGRGYASSRHNVGFRCVDEFARLSRISFSRRQGQALLAGGQVEGVPVLVAKPQTYMNLSGQSVAHLVHYYKVPDQDLLLVYDDLDLPVGKIRIRPGGGTGGHHGMQSIVTLLGRQDFPRLRVGIGRPAPGSTDQSAIAGFVLGEFSPAERTLMEQVYRRAAEAIHTFVVEGLQAAMNRYNVDS